jgi:hypothetical protein
MKKYLFLMLAIIGMAVSSCNKTDGNIVGVWKSSSDGEVVGIGMASTIVYTINKDNTYKKVTNFHIEESPFVIKETGKWNQAGNSLIFTDETTETGDTITFHYQVVKLTDTEMILGATDNTGDEWRYERVD